MSKKTFFASLLVACSISNNILALPAVSDSIHIMEEVVINTTRIPEIKTNSAATVIIIDSKQIAEMSKVTPDM